MELDSDDLNDLEEDNENDYYLTWIWIFMENIL